jgi:hypothetical protein
MIDLLSWCPPVGRLKPKHHSFFHKDANALLLAGGAAVGFDRNGAGYPSEGAV